MIAGKHDNGLTPEVIRALRIFEERPKVDHLSPLLDHFKIPHSLLIGNDAQKAEHTPPEGLYE